MKLYEVVHRTTLLAEKHTFLPYKH
jgi:hypothetical protein